MILMIKQSQASGTVTAPPSKSMAHRLLIAAALGKECRSVENLDLSEDIMATIRCLRGLGATLDHAEGYFPLTDRSPVRRLSACRSGRVGSLCQGRAGHTSVRGLRQYAAFSAAPCAAFRTGSHLYRLRKAFGAALGTL